MRTMSSAIYIAPVYCAHHLLFKLHRTQIAFLSAIQQLEVCVAIQVHKYLVIRLREENY
jgi:hypothetical protein